MMTIQEIKDAVDAGKDVHWANSAYKVIKDNLGQYFIMFTPTKYCIGLTNLAGDRLNGSEEDFFIVE